MAGCHTCGFEGPDDARYCARCGTGVGDGFLELLAVGATIRSQDSLALHQNSRRWPLVVLALAVVGWLAWPTVTSPASGGTAAQTTATTTATTRARPEARDAPSTTVADRGPTTSIVTPLAPRPTPTVPGTVPTTVATTVIGGGTPLLGEPTGLSLLVGNLAGLRRVELDTGVVATYGVAGWPLARAGTWLVVGNPNRSWLRAVPLADPETNPQLLGYTPAPAVAAPGAGPAQIWFLDYNAVDRRTDIADQPPTDALAGWRLVDLDTGDSLDTAPVPGGTHSTDDPGVGSSNGGGVFTSVVGAVAPGAAGPGVYDDEQVRKVFDGRPLAVSADHVLAQTCTLPTRCRLQWLDRATWQVVDRPLPEGRSFWDGWLSPDGRILAYFRDDAGAEVFDVATGRILDLAVVDPAQLALSPDGRYLAAATADAFVIHDLTTGRTTPLDLGRPADHHLLFVTN